MTTTTTTTTKRCIEPRYMVNTTDSSMLLPTITYWMSFQRDHGLSFRYWNDRERMPSILASDKRCGTRSSRSHISRMLLFLPGTKQKESSLATRYWYKWFQSKYSDFSVIPFHWVGLYTTRLKQPCREECAPYLPSTTGTCVVDNALLHYYCKETLFQSMKCLQDHSTHIQFH